MVSLDHGGHSYALPLFSYPAAAAAVGAPHSSAAVEPPREEEGGSRTFFLEGRNERDAERERRAKRRRRRREVRRRKKYCRLTSFEPDFLLLPFFFSLSLSFFKKIETMALASSSVRSSAAATARPVTASAFSRAAAPAPAAARRASKLPASRLAPSSLSNKASISTKAVAAPITSPAPGPPQTLVFVSAEVAPFSKTGGLGDVLNGLPATLASRGHRVVTIAPRCVCF